jgi:hypothetical protein
MHGFAISETSQYLEGYAPQQLETHAPTRILDNVVNLALLALYLLTLFSRSTRHLSLPCRQMLSDSLPIRVKESRSLAKMIAAAASV